MNSNEQKKPKWDAYLDGWKKNLSNPTNREEQQQKQPTEKEHANQSI